MGMGDKKVFDIVQGEVRLFQLAKDTIATSGICQKNLFAVFYRKTCIITAGHGCIACTQHNEFDRFHCLEFEMIKCYVIMDFLQSSVADGTDCPRPVYGVEYLLSRHFRHR